MANPGLNGLIVGVLVIGIAMAMRNVVGLIPEVRWVNSFRRRETNLEQTPPRLIAPMATLLRDRADSFALSTSTWRSILDSISTRLDENRDILRYLAGLLVFLGLLGTFWGLVTTVSSVGATIQSLTVGSGDAGIIFEDLKSGLAAPLAGMGIAFSSSLFGLSGSLVLGFLDLQAGQAQNRFYTELEDWLSTITDTEELGFTDEEIGNSTARDPQLRSSGSRAIVQEGGGGRASTAAMANLAEGIQGMVQHMRKEQQMVRDWMEAPVDAAAGAAGDAEAPRQRHRAQRHAAEAGRRGRRRLAGEEPDRNPARDLKERLIDGGCARGHRLRGSTIGRASSTRWRRCCSSSCSCSPSSSWRSSSSARR